VHTPSAREQAWTRLKETNPVFLKLGELRTAYDESENPVVSGLRTVTSTVGGWFAETERAQVVRTFRAMDPTFTMEVFERELREYIVPEVVDAYLTADGESLQKWCSEAVRAPTLHRPHPLTCMHRRTTCCGRRWTSTSSPGS
jgi:import inner membrane translocase subunit TIM44